jgi:ATP-dependent helicase/nuclease subunit B
LIREALEQPEQRVALITPDRGLAGRVVQHLRRWNIAADDTAGRPLSQTAAGRVLLLLADVLAHDAAPVPLLALLGHPLVMRGDARADWLRSVRALDLHLRGPRPAPGLDSVRALAAAAGQGAWWDEVNAILSPLLDAGERLGLADALDLLAVAGEALCGASLWEREDGRLLARFVEMLRQHARAAGTSVARDPLGQVLRDAMDRETVRPPYGAHARVAIYGLLESRMTRADLVISAGLNEGTWPAIPSSDPVLAPAILRALGVPGADFRIGLSAHDLAGALGAPQVVLSRSRRDAAGPVIASRFWLRVCALLGELLPDYQEQAIAALARAMDIGEKADAHPRPSPKPSAEQRRRGRISVTTLDRLRSDPYQFYAQKVLGLSELDLLDATPTAAWQGTLAHKILEDWHDDKGTLEQLAELHLAEMGAHPLMRALWRPRLMKALEWVQATVDGDAVRVPLKWEVEGKLDYRGVTITGKADRIDRLEGGALAIVDYKTGGPPSKKQVSDGFSMQLGTLGLMAADGAFNGVKGHPTTFEYWSLGKSDKSDTGFGYVTTPLKIGNAKTGIESDNFLPEARRFLDEALDTWILGSDGFTARLNPDAKVYTSYDQLMRLDEWMGREEDAA